MVGIEYEPVPVARRRDVDRCDLLREDVLVVTGASPAKRRAVRLAALENAAWASGHPGTGLDAVIRNVCNRLGGFEPDVRHRSDDAFVLSALVASGRAVSLLPTPFTATVPQIAAHRLRDERLQRTIFTATRTTTAQAPAVLAVRAALHDTARRVASRQRGIEVIPRPSP